EFRRVLFRSPSRNCGDEAAESAREPRGRQLAGTVGGLYDDRQLREPDDDALARRLSPPPGGRAAGELGHRTTTPRELRVQRSPPSRRGHIDAAGHDAHGPAV